MKGSHKEDPANDSHHIGCALGYWIHPSVNKLSSQLTMVSGGLYND
jgi:hypothetical protein